VRVVIEPLTKDKKSLATAALKGLQFPCLTQAVLKLCIREGNTSMIPVAMQKTFYFLLNLHCFFTLSRKAITVTNAFLAHEPNYTHLEHIEETPHRGAVEERLQQVVYWCMLGWTDHCSFWFEPSGGRWTWMGGFRTAFQKNFHHGRSWFDR
jgi:hypothetical protein